MIFGQALETFLLMAVAAALTTMAVLLTPLFISKVRPNSYRGFWKVAGDFLKENKPVIFVLPLGMFLGWILMFLYGFDRPREDIRSLYEIALGMFILFIAVVLSIRLYRLERRNSKSKN
jgi:hypothetical protein